MVFGSVSRGRCGKNTPRQFRGSSLSAMKILFHALVMFVLVFLSIPEADAEKTAALFK
jgi:hypothetical protein